MSTTNFAFSPVNVNRGRSFRGFGYYVGEGGISQPAWCVTIYKVKIWDPVNKRIVYVNSDYLEEANVPEAEVNAARQAYIDHTIQDTIKWCRTRIPNAPESEVKTFARNVLRKHHPEMIEFIDKATPDTRNVVDEVQRTLQWAMGLTTKSCWMYGRFCPGGKPVSDERKVRSAYTALQRKGVTKLDGFTEAWEMTLDIFGLPHVSALAE